LRLTTARLVLSSAIVGALVSVVCSSSLVDRTIGENLASDLLGYSATAAPITNTLMGAVFAFVSGLTAPSPLTTWQASALSPRSQATAARSEARCGPWLGWRSARAP